MPSFLFFSFILFYFFSTGQVICATDVIKLNSKNNIILRGVINHERASQVIRELNTRNHKNETYLILDTPGGDVEAGMQIMNEVKNHNVKCIVQRAYSMGFVILQACSTRYILPFGSVMQHQISFGIRGELGKVKSYTSLVEQYENYLADLQSKRIRMSVDAFVQKTTNEWWLFGENIIFENVGDTIVNVECDVSLTKKNVTIPNGGFDYIYSACPLITKELEKNRNSESREYVLFI